MDNPSLLFKDIQYLVANIDIAKTQYSNLNPNTNLILYNNNNLIKEEDQIKIDNNLINEDQIKN
ncbi:hypothetical protein C2G38_2169094 [Gigaspora rosea]|uniref:Uncharacterized protein n=1 Tax=Gigaspora rosea TaxID=44941 RepID=A0A397VP28_9GLOM|nr:hypothetical protein C2G38_2169094 [Gigaspora rosea]